MVDFSEVKVITSYLGSKLKFSLSLISNQINQFLALNSRKLIISYLQKHKVWIIKTNNYQSLSTTKEIIIKLVR